MEPHNLPEATAGGAVDSAENRVALGGRSLPPAAARPGNASSPSLIPTAVTVCGLLLLAVALVFGRTIGFDFVNYDDPQYVCENPHISNGLSAAGIVWAFTHSHVNNWDPMTSISHMLDCQLYGLKPWGFHLTNVLLHAATSILLFLVLWRMTGDLWPSAFVAAVFAIHPLQVEPVAWVSERKGLLSGLFFVLCLAAYLGYVRHPASLGRYLLLAALFVLGLMAKAILVTLPCVLLLLDYWPLRRFGTPLCSQNNARLVLEKIPLFLVMAVFSVVTFIAEGDAVAGLERLPVHLRIENALVSYVAYLGHLVYPVDLAAFYPHPAAGLPMWKPIGALLVLVIVLAAVVARRRQNPYLLVGWLWYLGVLVPVSGLVQIGGHAMADRYAYLPHIGLMIALAWAAKDTFQSSPRGARLCGAASMLAILVLMGCAWRQTSYSRDSETLWRRDLDCVGSNVIAHDNLGLVFAGRGQFDEAMAEYQKSLDVNPNDWLTHSNFGLALAKIGRRDEAMRHYQKTLEIKPDFAEARYNFGLALAESGEIDEAMAQYEQALQIDPDFVEARNNLGLALAGRGRFDEAVTQYEKALELKPDYLDARNNLGLALASAGQFEAALVQYRKAVEIHPNSPETRYNLGLALARGGQADEAIGHFGKAVQLNPNYAEAHSALGIALAQCGRLDEAILHFQKAVELKPDDAGRARTSTGPSA